MLNQVMSIYLAQVRVSVVHVLIQLTCQGDAVSIESVLVSTCTPQMLLYVINFTVK